MRRRGSWIALGALGVCLAGLSTGCETTDGGDLGGGMYYGTGFYDPWYYGGYDDGPDVIVTPPTTPPPRPTHPIAPTPPAMRPRPMPMPSIPARPMPRGR